MKPFCLLIVVLCCLLPHFVLSQHRQNHKNSHNINKVFARRARASHHKHQPTSRQFRYSRFIQDQDVQQKSTDELEDIEPEIEQQEQMMEKFSQSPMQERMTTKSGNQFTQSPFQTYETSTPRTLQQKEEDQDFAQLSQPQTGSDFEDEELSNDFGINEPNQDISYSSNKHQGNGQRKSSSSSHSSDGSDNSDDFGNDEDHNTVDWLRQSVRGEPGQDYPIYSTVPETSFKCADQQYPGYYADVEAQCQVFHMCQQKQDYAFLCPNGTIFSQNHFVCVWWFDFDCSSAEQLYSLNSQLYQESPSSGSNGANGGNGGSGGSRGSSSPSKLSSPKENLNKMYVSQIDEFGENALTTSAPSYSSNGKGSMRSTKNGYNKPTTISGQYDFSSVESVTPSGIDDDRSYDTTPYNLDEALGEEIHSETPLIESLPLTTILPKLSGLSSFGPSTSSPRGFGNGNNNYNNYNQNQFPSSPMNNYGSSNSNKMQQSYGGSSGVKGGSSKSNKQSTGSSLPESPARKNSRNGGSKSSYGSSSQSKGGANKSGLKW